MKKTLKALIVATVLIVGSTGASAASGTTNPADPDRLTPDELRSQYTNEELFYTPEVTHESAEAGPDGSLMLRGAGYVILCSAKANAPHISKGAGGVIYKTRITCTGTGDYPSPIDIYVDTALYHIRADSPTDTDDTDWHKVFSGGEPRTVDVNGAAETFYAPHEGMAGRQGKGFWQGTSIVSIEWPQGIKSGNDTSDVWFRDTTVM